MPPLWSFGYQQSHRTLARREEMLSIATNLPRKAAPMRCAHLPRDRLLPFRLEHRARIVHLQPQGVPRSQAEMLDELHALHFHVVPHVVVRSRSLAGRSATARRRVAMIEEDAARYWTAHRKVFALGVDGWWPDEGDPFNPASRLARIRMYWEGPQLDRPDARALTHCTATVTPACSATGRSSGRATSTPPGRP